MLHRIARHVRHNALGMVAIFLALTGGAYALGQLPRNSVGSKQLRNGAVTGRKVARNTLTGNNINASTLGTVPTAAHAATSDQLGGLGPAAFQLRVSGACASGAINAVNQNGTVGCAASGGPPSGSAGGDLTGTYPNPTVANGAITDASVAAANKDGIASTPSLRTLGTGALQAMPGNATPGGPPTGTAGGALGGTYPGPTLNVSGGDSGATACKNGEALSALSTLAALTCKPGVFSDAHNNVGVGPASSFAALTIGSGNVALGAALQQDTAGSKNTAIGINALQLNATGDSNTATGTDALEADTAADNTATGTSALQSNTTGNNNTATGVSALFANTSGIFNTAAGHDTLESNNGDSNTATGNQALLLNTTGGGNTAAGALALEANTTGSNNAALGSQAGDRLTTGSNNIDINNNGAAGDANTIKIGVQGLQTSTLLAGVNGTSITGPTGLVLNNSNGRLGTNTTGAVSLPSIVDGSTSSSGVDLLINSSGVLGTATSSRRFKTDIRPIGPATERTLKALRPVSFHYKARYIKGQPNPLEYGLIAEQVAKVDPSLVAYGTDGKPYTVRYQELPALLLAQIQSQQRQISAQRAQIKWLMTHARLR